MLGPDNLTPATVAAFQRAARWLAQPGDLPRSPPPPGVGSVRRRAAAALQSPASSGSFVTAGAHVPCLTRPASLVRFPHPPTTYRPDCRRHRRWCRSALPT